MGGASPPPLLQTPDVSIMNAGPPLRSPAPAEPSHHCHCSRCRSKPRVPPSLPSPLSSPAPAQHHRCSCRHRSSCRSQPRSSPSPLSPVAAAAKQLKTKELIINFCRSHNGEYAPIFINGNSVERVSSFKFLGTHISKDLTWSTNTATLVKKAQQRLFYLRTLKVWSAPTAADDLLPLHHREHPNAWHPCVVSQLHGGREESSSAGSP
ncbi:uncharacterized protein LOC144599117 [Rhinoraja longicauda]